MRVTFGGGPRGANAFSTLATPGSGRLLAWNGMPNPDVNLYLVGFMGTGKTTVGRAVAQKLGFQLLDSDHEIERRKQKPVAQIFAEEGEAAFRVLEREFVEAGHPPRQQVVACGGGLIVPPGMLEMLQEKGVVMCLHASLETILRRTQGNRNRPLLNVDDPGERIRTLFAQREPVYKRAGTTILTDGRQLTDIVSHVLRAYRREAEEWTKARLHGNAGG
jgi:shikimate kinase